MHTSTRGCKENICMWKKVVDCVIGEAVRQVEEDLLT